MQRARCGWMGVDARGKAQPLDESIELGGLHRARSMVAFRELIWTLVQDGHH